MTSSVIVSHCTAIRSIAHLKGANTNGRFVVDAKDNERAMRLVRAVVEPCRSLWR